MGSLEPGRAAKVLETNPARRGFFAFFHVSSVVRSEEHTSELQSQSNLVCRLLLETNNRERCPSYGRSGRSPPPGPAAPRPFPRQRPSDRESAPPYSHREPASRHAPRRNSIVIPRL